MKPRFRSLADLGSSPMAVLEPTPVAIVWMKWDSVCDMLSPESGTQHSVRGRGEGEEEQKSRTQRYPTGGQWSSLKREAGGPGASEGQGERTWENFRDGGGGRCKKGCPRTRAQCSKGPGGEGGGLATDEVQEGVEGGSSMWGPIMEGPSDYSLVWLLFLFILKV